jgi:hypothetical protein
MKYAVEMSSGAMIYIPSFSGSKFYGGCGEDTERHGHTDSMEIAQTSFNFFKIKSRLIHERLMR